MMTTQPLPEIKPRRFGLAEPGAYKPAPESRITPANEIVREIGRTHPRDITQLVRAQNDTTGEQTVYFADEFAAFPVYEANGGVM